MADFKVEVIAIDDVYKHPDADTLWIVVIRGFRCIFAVPAGTERCYARGDLVAYIPEGALLPDEMLQSMNFWKDGKGTLAGKHGNRVKAIKLRGVVSQGILYKIDQASQRIRHPNGNTKFVNEGDDVAEFLGVTKWEPILPASMSGEVVHIGREYTLNYDIENIQKYPAVFNIGEPVLVTEKLHGTFCGLGYNPNLNHPDLLEGKFFAFSKGLGAQGLVFKDNETNRARNVYHKTLVENLERFKAFIASFTESFPIIVCGEVYGPGIQDLHYGEKTATFRVFDIYQGYSEVDGLEGYIDAWDLLEMSEIAEKNEYPFWKLVPPLYMGHYMPDKIEELRDGKTILGGVNVREGVVIKAIQERTDPVIGRVILKAVSPDYLLRKGNVTEFN